MGLICIRANSIWYNELIESTKCKHGLYPLRGDKFIAALFMFTFAYSENKSQKLQEVDSVIPWPDNYMEISHPCHPHKLVLKYATFPYYCWGCDQLGFGLTYICIRSGCNFFLHKECGKPQALIAYPFSEKCVLKFRDGGLGEDSPCDACGKKVKRFHYRCLCTFQKRNLHPSCLNHEKTLEAANGLTMTLKKAATAKCLHCGTKDLWSKVRGWAYVSSCGSYCYHVSCVREIVIKNWRYGFFTGKSDPFHTIKQQFPEDVEKMHHDQLVVARKKQSNNTRKQATAILSVIFNVITGNPMGLIGAAQTYFSN
ncbi:protein VACUOLELESS GAMETOPHYTES-like [Rutidosis leptorrhynchoides]|uniref:protein VACUOLELESS GAMETOPHYTES-like n=1 Tax=Rutidosis leptorrhynchoides TaxID=125765 RepID=UPI003A98FE9D